MHRFADPEYAAISLALRTEATTYPLPGKATGVEVGKEDGERVGDVWDALCGRNQVRIYPSEVERTQALAQDAADTVLTARRNSAGTVVMADTREQVTALNGAVRDRVVAAGYVDDTNVTVTGAGERVGVGDRVATRRNDRDLGVTNRAIWTVTAVGADGSLTLRGRRAADRHTVPAAYMREHVYPAYATTVYGAQGATTGTGHLALGERTSAASAYVAMTPGRDHNVVHLVAENMQDAHRQWDDVFSGDRADLGPAIAAQRAAQEVDRYSAQIPSRPLDDILVDLRAAWTQQADLTEQCDRLTGERDDLRKVAAIRAWFAPDQQRLNAEQSTAKTQWLNARSRVTDLEHTLTNEATDLRTRVWDSWRHDLAQAQQAARLLEQGAGRFGQRRRLAHAATNELTEFAQRWRPVHPDLPSDPIELARQVRWLHGHQIEEQIDAYVTVEVADAHPEADSHRQVEHAAWVALEAAEKARTRLDNTMYAELHPHGRHAHVPDPIGRLTTVAEQLATVEDDLTTTTTRVGHLRNEPAIRALPADVIDTEHAQWAAERVAQRESVARQAQARWRRQQRANRIGPNQPEHRTRERGPSIGR